MIRYEGQQHRAGLKERMLRRLQIESSVVFESYFSSNFSGILIHGHLLIVTLKLAQVSLLLDELGVVVLAVEPALMCNVVRWADCTPSMCAFETHLVVRSSVH